MALTDQGFTVLRTADLITIIREEYIREASLPEGTDLSDDALLGIFVGVIAARLDAAGQASVAAYDSFNENNAVKAQLDNLNALRGVRRKQGTKSRVPGTLTGTSGQAVASGVIVQGGGTDGTARWVSLEDVTLTGGTATVTLEAEDVGATTVDPGNAAIVTPRDGLDSVTFGSPVTLGSATENDADFRLRGAVSTSTPGAHTASALMAAVLAVAAVTDAFVIDNPDNAQQTIDGVVMPAHTHIVYVLPNPLSAADQTLVLDAIADNLHIGTRTNATDVTRVETHAPTGASYTIGFDYGILVPVTIVATLTLASGTALADASAALETAIETYIGTLRMGDALRHLTLCQLAAGIEGINAATFTINGSAADLEPNGNQVVSGLTFSAVTP